MRRLWLSLALLGLIFAATVGNSLYLRHLTETITGLLEEAQVQAQEEDWEAAAALTEEHQLPGGGGLSPHPGAPGVRRLQRPAHRPAGAGGLHGAVQPAKPAVVL